MSGIAGIFRTDGAPVDPRLIQRLTSSLSFRGPDARQVWIDGPVAFGHTLLRTTDEAENERQPFTLDGNVWIVADARVDARRELVRELDGPASLLRVPDVELILRAYLRWGESCVERLLGDFAFAVWDSRSKRLFCARDHLGVKPFYYAHLGPWLIFSNTLDCVRLHPAVSDKLNDLAIADFLLFSRNQDSATTSFSDIQRLSPAHTLRCSDAGFHMERYWTLPIEEPVYYRDDREYIDRFRGLLHQAVSDRLRTPRVGVFMSGGLDSPALAAAAVECLKTPDAVQAFTLVYDHLIPDSERYYAGLAARHLRIPIQFFALDGKTDWAPQSAHRTPEPVQDLSDPEPRMRYYAAMAAHSRVAFYGEGPDNALEYEWRPHLAWLADERRWGRLMRDVGKHIWHHKRVPLLPTIPRMLRNWRKRKHWEPAFPAWLNRDLVERLDLQERWRAFNAAAGPSPHPVRPRAYSSFSSHAWPSLFEALEPPHTNAALEVRHPFVDLRLLCFLLKVPALSWCRDKYLLRCALRSVVPEIIQHRPKTPLQKLPEYERAGVDGMPPVIAGSRLVAYGDSGMVPLQRSPSIPGFYTNFRFAALSHWLRHLDSSYIFRKEEQKHEFAEDIIAAGPA